MRDGVRKDAAAAYVLYNAAAHPPKGVSPDRNAAAGARNVKKFMKADDLARAEKLTLAEIFNELSESGIDESGQLSGYVNQVNRSRAVTVIIWLSMAEVVAVVLFFIVVNLPFVKKRMHTDVY